MKNIALKFGGSSLADAEQFKKVAGIVKANPSRRFVVASAPGKRHSKDTKVTDMLYKCYDMAVAGEDYPAQLALIRERFADIVRDLGLSFDIDGEIEIIKKHLSENPQRDYMASRGEYLNSKILAEYLGFTFVDPANCVFFTEDGIYDADKTNKVMAETLSCLDNAVVAGFYGSLPDGTIHTFSRGGSDLSGSIVAAAINAEIYENWTDVSGMLAADPRIVENPRVIDFISYQELRELSYMGASVLHEDAVFPVRRAGIPINIRNTNRPEDAGTIIEAILPRSRKPHVVTGIAGSKGFTSIQVEKSMMNATVGFGAKLLQILASHGVSFEHCPTGIDTMSVFVSSEDLKGKKDDIVQDVKAQLSPDILTIEDNFALLAVVGQGMPYSRSISSTIFKALADAGIDIRMIDLGSSGLNIIIGVSEEDYENAIRSIYAAVM